MIVHSFNIFRCDLLLQMRWQMSLIFQSYDHLKKDLLAFRHCYITMSIERPIIKKKLRYLQKTFERTL